MVMCQRGTSENGATTASSTRSQQVCDAFDPVELAIVAPVSEVAPLAPHQRVGCKWGHLLRQRYRLCIVLTTSVNVFRWPIKTYKIRMPSALAKLARTIFKAQPRQVDYTSSRAISSR